MSHLGIQVSARDEAILISRRAHNIPVVSVSQVSLLTGDTEHLVTVYTIVLFLLQVPGKSTGLLVSYVCCVDESLCKIRGICKFEILDSISYPLRLGPLIQRDQCQLCSHASGISYLPKAAPR